MIRFGILFGRILAAVALVSGCGDDGSASDAESRDGADVVEEILEAERAGPRAEAAERERTLVLAVRSVPTELDPMEELEPWARRIVDDALFEGLTRRRSDVAPFAEPAVADRCVTQPRDVYCHLRPGVLFHDGTPVTSEDVVYSLEYWLDHRRASLRFRHGLSSLRRVELVDRPPGATEEKEPGRWVRLSFDRDEPLALERITTMKIVPRAAHRGHARRFARNPIGTGPLKLVANEDDQLVLERVAPQGGEEEVLRVVLQEVTDGARALTLLRRGEVHIVAEVAPAYIPDELAKPGMAPRFDAYVLSPPRWDLLVYNLRRGAQAGPQMRKLLDASIPRGALDEVYHGPSGSTLGPIDIDPPRPVDLELLGREALSARWGMAGLPERPQYDDEAAAAAAAAQLDELGWLLDRGVRKRATGSLRLSVMWGGPGLPKSIARLLRDQWRSIGIIVPFATASWQYVFGLMRRAEFEMGLVRLATGSDADLYDYLHSRGEQNLSGVADGALDEALEAYRNAQDREGRDAARAAIAARLDALKPMSVLYTPTQVMLVSARLTNITFIDDLPNVAELGLGPESTWIAGR